MIQGAARSRHFPGAAQLSSRSRVSLPRRSASPRASRLGSGATPREGGDAAREFRDSRQAISFFGGRDVTGATPLCLASRTIALLAICFTPPAELYLDAADRKRYTRRCPRSILSIWPMIYARQAMTARRICLLPPVNATIL